MNVDKINRYYLSSKTYLPYGYINNDINTNFSALKDRLFTYDCDFDKDRDLNASINLRH